MTTLAENAPDNPLISIVLPVYNEVEAIEQLLDLVRQAVDPLACRYQVIFVNDGSADGSGEKLDSLAVSDRRIQVVHFARNFGHQAAVHAGLSYARGDAVVVMDSDLQDDPACIPELLDYWRQGFEVVYAVRTNRKESWLKRGLFFGFYRVLNAVSNTRIPLDAGNFGLMDRRVAELICEISDCDRFFPGLRSWVGFRQIGVPVERLARHDEQPRVSMYQLFQLAKTAIFSFSRAPLSIFYALAGCSTLICLACFAFALYHKMFTSLAIPGWTSSIMIASLFGALNSLGIGVLGEYVVRIYDQVRGRPAFLVDRLTNESPPRHRPTSAASARATDEQAEPSDWMASADPLVDPADLAADIEEAVRTASRACQTTAAPVSRDSLASPPLEPRAW